MKETLRFIVTPEEAGVLIAARASEELDGREASAAADAVVRAIAHETR